MNVLQENRVEITQLYSHTALGLNLPSLDSGGRRKENPLSTVGKKDRSAEISLEWVTVLLLVKQILGSSISI